MPDFSFVKNSVNPQTPQQTLLVLAYELGKVIEYHHKARIYGPTAYYSDANQQREMSDLISMARMYWEQMGWEFAVGFYVGLAREVRTPEDVLCEIITVIGYLASPNSRASHSRERRRPMLLVFLMRYCELKGWDFEALKSLGEECYLERMADIKKYGVKPL